jgi:predicted ATPase
MTMINPNLLVVTGGPGAGKTTLLCALQELGFPHLPEVARQIITEQVRDHGSALPWDDRDTYTRLMLERSVQSYLDNFSIPSLTFADRGIPDTLTWSRLIQYSEEAAIRAACERYRYASQVFLAPPWQEIYATDSERKQDFAEAQRTFALNVDVYRECGYRLIEIPRATPRDRALFVLRELGSLA